MIVFESSWTVQRCNFFPSTYELPVSFKQKIFILQSYIFSICADFEWMNILRSEHKFKLSLEKHYFSQENIALALGSTLQFCILKKILTHFLSTIFCITFAG